MSAATWSSELARVPHPTNVNRTLAGRAARRALVLAFWLLALAGLQGHRAVSAEDPGRDRSLETITEGLAPALAADDERLSGDNAAVLPDGAAVALALIAAPAFARPAAVPKRPRWAEPRSARGPPVSG